MPAGVEKCATQNQAMDCYVLTVYCMIRLFPEHQPSLVSNSKPQDQYSVRQAHRSPPLTIPAVPP